MLSFCYRWNGSHIYEKIIGTEWLNPQGDNVSDLTAKTIFPGDFPFSYFDRDLQNSQENQGFP